MSSAEARPIRRLLVANRGEIARRIFRTAHEMGIETVAVFSDGDAAGSFVGDADVAVALGGRAAVESYLDVEKILDAARLTGADAVHPGYGFLAENAAFASAVVDAGMVWVGPNPAAIASMGDKLAAKALMVEADVPTLPSIEITDDVDVLSAAGDIGYPVLVKAAAGGGGKGMRVVTEADRLVDSVAAAKREAASAFGDDTVFLEKYLPAPRHVEVQVIGDKYGRIVALGERECSIQRRHQKIIEEAPSPAVDDTLRAEMCAAALAAVRPLDYDSVGTVEFLLDGEGGDERFWFLEVNTRIQVEHPVTEEVTGVDLIREQIRVACGHPLELADDIPLVGHAIEARLYAEDADNDFLPATGTVRAFEAADVPAVRIDTGIEAGAVVGVEFDPMLAKVIAHAPTRAEAAGRLALALDRLAVAGLTTNRDFLVRTLRTAEFLAGETRTDFIGRVELASVDDAFERSLWAIGLVAQARNRAKAGSLAFMRSGYRNSSMPPESMRFALGDRQLELSYRPAAGGFEMWVDDGVAVVAAGEIVGDDGASATVVVQADGMRTRHRVTSWDDRWSVSSTGSTVDLVELSRFPETGAVDVVGGQTAPMPGKVLSVHVVEGDAVIGGQALVVMEAMKMEHTISAPDEGVVTEVRCAAGDQVDNGEVLIVLGPPPTE